MSFLRGIIMKKICGICNTNKIYSETRGYCSDCRKKILVIVNSNIMESKYETRNFFSTSKSRKNKDSYYNKIKNCIEILNTINSEYPYIIKSSKTASEYIQEVNKSFETIEKIIQKNGVSA